MEFHRDPKGLWRATPPGAKFALRSLSDDASHRRSLGLLRPPLPGPIKVIV